MKVCFSRSLLQGNLESKALLFMTLCKCNNIIEVTQRNCLWQPYLLPLHWPMFRHLLKLSSQPHNPNFPIVPITPIQSFPTIHSTCASALVFWKLKPQSCLDSTTGFVKAYSRWYKVLLRSRSYLTSNWFPKTSSCVREGLLTTRSNYFISMCSVARKS